MMMMDEVNENEFPTSGLLKATEIGLMEPKASMLKRFI